MKRVITFGTFDLFHIGHLRILERARAMGDYLVVGVSTDELNHSKKGKNCIIPYGERAEIVRAIRFVDDVFPEESLELKRDYIVRFAADILIMGDDWAGRFDDLGNICQVKYLPRTPLISTTEIKEFVRGKTDIGLADSPAVRTP